MPKTIRTNGQQALCRILVEARKAAGLTQEGLAERLHCQQSLIARLESGERRLDVIEFIAVARALRIEPGELMGRIGPFVPEEQTL